MPHLLLINPWIYDFAAYDLWAKPLGLLYLASLLRERGYGVDLIDCMDRHHPGWMRAAKPPKVRRGGVGPFRREKIAKPALLASVPRHYARYGIPEEVFRQELCGRDRPDAVLVTSMMTYWYPGVFRVIEWVKQQWPDVPVVLGGIYATLCTEHARTNSGADMVLSGPGEQTLPDVLPGLVGGPSLSDLPEQFEDFPSPAWDLYSKLDYACLMTSRGCPFHCSFCASKQLFDGFERGSPEKMLDEIDFLFRKRRIHHFAFYDDALLLDASNRVEPLLDGLIERRLECAFHTPNGLHAREITVPLAQKMHEARFQTIRLSFESASAERQRKMGTKVTNTGLENAIEHLKSAGYRGKDLETYILVGLPGQSLQEVIESVVFVARCGVKTKIALFSPIPGTREWQRAVDEYGFDADADPLLHNNTLHPFRSQDMPEEAFQQVAGLVNLINHGLDMDVNLFEDSAVSREVWRAVERLSCEA